MTIQKLIKGKHYRQVRLILGDQLNSEHSWFKQPQDDVLYLIAELVQEQTYVRHHRQKQVAFFAAMQAFADDLAKDGHQVVHLTLDDTAVYQSLPPLISDVCQVVDAKRFCYQRPDEYRLLSMLRQLSLTDCQVVEFDTEHFLCEFDRLLEEFPSGKAVRMEHFYRRMRKRHGVLVDSEEAPEGGKWNYDVDNRHKLKASDIAELPEPLVFSNPVGDIIERLREHQLLGFGHVDQALLWPINRAQALNLLAHFCRVCLPNFGTFQDAMTAESTSRWSLYHSRLSFALNCKLLSPREVIDAAERVYNHNPSKQALAQVEGFVRQILGWREYIRGMYWANMPDYPGLNHLRHQRALPDFYWNGQTKMRCMQQAIEQSLHYAYAHHIQRLMITGNFALLAELAPAEVHQWYLGIYIDAIEWVELPNTLGMALYADGGLIASKPYISSGAYINRMSDYCRGCHYQVKLRSGEGACPFNPLYWRFMVKHRDWLARNPRMNMVYRNWDKLSDPEQDEILQTAEFYLRDINQL
ncbi:cryptochrome/photolyase family protein [Vibrio sp. WXL103]|uniref:cryptochrome/photolyase family protein n=1 Tax=unclassified Vibrio TaxID=2614977 RepID=UPI003EC8549E